MNNEDNRNRERYLVRRRNWLESAKDLIRPGRIAGLGCGSGFAIRVLSDMFPKSALVGVDLEYDRLSAMKSKHLPQVATVCGDIRRLPLLDGVFDTVCSLSTLHVLYSRFGPEGVISALAAAKGLLRQSGRLLVQDYMKPDSQPVEMRMTSDRAGDWFDRFATEFEPRRVEFIRGAGRVRLDIADAIEFLAKYKYAGTDVWAEEMTETHMYFTEEEFTAALSDLGMTVLETRILPGEKPDFSYDDIDYNFEAAVDWIQVVAEK